jgi:hypothetical protein
MCSESTSHRSKKCALSGRGRITIGAGFLERLLARPHQHVHAERLAISRDNGADPAIAIDAQGLAAQRVADADLPMTRLQRRHLLRDLTHRRQHQTPGEFAVA